MIDSNNRQFQAWAIQQLPVEYLGALMAEFRQTHKLVRLAAQPSIPISDKLIKQFDTKTPKEV